MKGLTIKVNQFLLFWILLIVVLIYGRPLLIPITFASLLSMLMAPLIDFLDRKGLKRVFSTIVCLFILLASIVLVGVIFIGQISNIQQELPVIEERANELILSLHSYIEDNFQFPVDMQQEYLKKQIASFGESSGKFLTQALSSISGVAVQTIITLVISFLLL